MKLTVILAKSAQKQLDKLPDEVAERVLKKLTLLESNPRSLDTKKLKGSNAYRVRVGDYRVIYEIHDGHLLVIVIEVGHRREIYRSD